MTIYIIRNLVDWKTYIGQSVKWKRRLSVHKTFLKKGTHWNTHLQSAWDLYGADQFEFFALCECDCKSELDHFEKAYIRWFKELGLCYNFTDGGEGTLGWRHPEEVSRATADKNRGRKWTDEQKAKLVGRPSARKGVEVTADTREKMRQAKLGKPAPHAAANALKMNAKREFTPEYRKKLSDANKGNQNFLGKSHSEEMKKTMSEARKGAGNPMFGRKWTMIDGKRVLV